MLMRPSLVYNLKLVFGGRFADKASVQSQGQQTWHTNPVLSVLCRMCGVMMRVATKAGAQRNATPTDRLAAVLINIQGDWIILGTFQDVVAKVQKLCLSVLGTMSLLPKEGAH